MDYREIVAVTGMGGLYQLLTSKNDGAIVRALADGKTVFVSARKHQLTPLESIEIYTTGENVRLHNVLQKMQEQEGTTPLPDTKDPKAIGAYFGTVFPEYDESRVYASDLKKMVRWYSLLKDADMLDFSRYNEEEEEGQEGDSPMEQEAPMPLEGKVQVKESKKKEVTDDEAASQSVEGGNADEASDAPPAKKTRAKKATTESAGEEATEEEAPAKKPRAKKAAADADATGEEAAPKKTTRKKKGDDTAGE